MTKTVEIYFVNGMHQVLQKVKGHEEETDYDVFFLEKDVTYSVSKRNVNYIVCYPSDIQGS